MICVLKFILQSFSPVIKVSEPQWWTDSAGWYPYVSHHRTFHGKSAHIQWVKYFQSGFPEWTGNKLLNSVHYFSKKSVYLNETRLIGSLHELEVKKFRCLMKRIYFLRKNFCLEKIGSILIDRFLWKLISHMFLSHVLSWIFQYCSIATTSQSYLRS